MQYFTEESFDDMFTEIDNINEPLGKFIKRFSIKTVKKPSKEAVNEEVSKISR